jgi:hypothetical protein
MIMLPGGWAACPKRHCRGIARILGEAARLTAVGALDAISQVSVAAVKDLAEQAGAGR